MQCNSIEFSLISKNVFHTLISHMFPKIRIKCNIFECHSNLYYTLHIVIIFCFENVFMQSMFVYFVESYFNSNTKNYSGKHCDNSGKHCDKDKSVSSNYLLILSQHILTFLIVLRFLLFLLM